MKASQEFKYIEAKYAELEGLYASLDCYASTDNHQDIIVAKINSIRKELRTLEA